MTRVWTVAGKAVTGGLTLAGAAVAAGLLHGTVLVVVEAVLAVAGTTGIYHAPYQPSRKPGPVVDVEPL